MGSNIPGYGSITEHSSTFRSARQAWLFGTDVRHLPDVRPRGREEPGLHDVVRGRGALDAAPADTVDARVRVQDAREVVPEEAWRPGFSDQNTFKYKMTKTTSNIVQNT